MARVVFLVETNERDDFAMKRNLSREVVHFGAFSEAKQAVISPFSLPNTTLGMA